MEKALEDDNFDAEIDVPDVGTITLDVIKKYPYKIECGKKPPKYDAGRMDALKNSIGVVLDKSEIILDDLHEFDEKEFNEYLETVEETLEIDA